jgi:hypothetical protein
MYNNDIDDNSELHTYIRALLEIILIAAQGFTPVIPDNILP